MGARLFGGIDLRKGSEGDDVKGMQERLKSGGYYSGGLSGVWDDDTDTAYKKWQTDNGFDSDGVYNRNAHNKMYGIANDGYVGDFSYDDFKKSDDLVAKESERDDSKMNLDAVIEKILNREPFSYDFNGDALYQQYKDKYIQQGRMAMQDTIGQASAMTGGYGNSYAASVGNQAYQSHLNNLNDVIPELYQLAYDKYAREGDELNNEYAIAKDRYDNASANADELYNREYGVWKDKVAMDYDLHNDKQQSYYNNAVVNNAISSVTTNNTTNNTTNKVVYARQDIDGNFVYYVNGKEQVFSAGVNPYTGKKNPDIANGTFDGNYQPDNVGGDKLTETDETDVINGDVEPIYTTPDGQKWIWNKIRNEYSMYEEE